MQSQDVAQRPAPSSATSDAVVDVEQAEAALVEHYPRLVRLAYLILPPGLGRRRRVLTAHALVQRALPRNRTTSPLIPAQSAGRGGDPGYALVRLRVVRTALEAARPLRRPTLPRRSQLPPLLPRVRGLVLYPRSGGADELALDQELSELSAPARAAHVLRGLERMSDDEVAELLDAAGAPDPEDALLEAGEVPARYRLLSSPEFDACSLQARPTDLLRRRQHGRAALVAGAALVVCGALLGLPGDGWGPDGPAAPAYARNPAAEAALDPGRLTRAGADDWRTAARADLSVWPVRGDLTGDRELLRRALAVWARPGEAVSVSATPGTATGGPSGPARLLYAGNVDNARVVILFDGLRVVRYAEPRDDTRGAALDFARADGDGLSGADAVVLGRADGNVRYLTAPWVTSAAQRDLTDAGAEPTALSLADGVTSPLAGPAAQAPGGCASWNVLALTEDANGAPGNGGSLTRVLTDLGELVPARLTTGRPGDPGDLSGAEALADWAPYACSLGAVRGQGVRSVNAWEFAAQPLPDGTGAGSWVCTRAETWRGEGARVTAQFRTPGGTVGAVTARAEDVRACGERDPRVLAGVLWKSSGGHWYLLAAGGGDVASIAASGGVTGSAEGGLLTAAAEQGARAELKGTLEGGGTITGLGG
ncbi:hypothetical protein AB0M23_03175 [Streptomyces sp. NPDC052077]|uniref:hypothetical protein n=1 Tax=Streptomyces sp. NPDC052077 TaxID=3154757 RepID=UPI003446412E